MNEGELMEANFEIGEKVKCKKFGALNHDFVGSIEKIYENSAMVSIIEHDDSDELAVSDFHKRAIVRLKSMKKIS
ncbi:hypothetical protein FC19_GL000948 [Liquorilactobacillus aquaticus DSM 21051]|uniref:DUF2187 domain-containing protein n=2 Tax=Liquorilactobacillus aquaticus TaxID=392566 RepID=A0A0R2CZQ2_9LACO|nr:hypothetical protein FC19_GL000948 [Liquorilactobacillus aquaticus DSM 21051]